MKYETEVIVNLPRERVIALFDSTENLEKWQDGLKSSEHLSGDPGQPGAKMKLVYDNNGREIEMIETITHRNLPDEFHGTYEADGVYNVMENYFYAEGPEKTRWKAISEFQFSGFMMKAMGFLMPGMFRKQTKKTMEAFKQFAENA